MSATRTPTVEEWYGASYTPTFPDDDGEEMRRVSSSKPVSQAEYDKLVRDHADMLATLKRAVGTLDAIGDLPSMRADLAAAISKAESGRTALSTANGRETP